MRPERQLRHFNKKFRKNPVGHADFPKIICFHKPLWCLMPQPQSWLDRSFLPESHAFPVALAKYLFVPLLNRLLHRIDTPQVESPVVRSAPE
jgi:hypothetical protein